MSAGTVKWFNRKRGFGFIEPDGGGEDAFVHISAIKKAGLKTLIDGQRLQFEMAPLSDGRLAANGLELLDEPLDIDQVPNLDQAPDLDQAAVG